MAITNMTSVELAYQEYQRQAIPRITYLAQTGGAPVDRETPDWEYVGIRKDGHCWQNRGERDIIRFAKDPKAQEYIRIPGAVVPGELSPVMAIVESILNDTDEDQPEAWVEYERGLTVSRREVDRAQLGVSISSFIEAQGGGGETTGGSYVKVGTSSTFSAEYEKALEDGRDESGVTTTHIAAIPKARHVTAIEQTIQKGVATCHITERMVIDPAFWYVDWKKLNRGWLEGNRDYSGWSGKSRVLWKVESIGELKAILEGRHPEYPGARGKNLLGEKWIRYNYEWLANEDNRSFECQTVVKFDTALAGDAAIRYTPV